MKTTWYTQRWVVLLLHALAWVVVFSSPYLIQALQRESREQVPEEHNIFLSLITNVCWVVIFYLNAGVLVPRLLYPKRYGAYAIVAVGLFLWMLVQTSLLFQLFYGLSEFNPRMHLFFVLFVLLLMLASSTAYRLVRDRIKTERAAKEKENEHLKTELAFLRSQVSPHFIFNVLNNMVALARKGSKDLEPSLIRLSSLLRYMLYETNEEKVSLYKELDYLKSYIDLQAQRFGSKVAIDVYLKEPEETYHIEPMLLIPFVENAFKHGSGAVAGAAIHIELSAQDQVLHFGVRNRYNKTSREVKDKTSGIGLQNVQRRLNLLYRNNHELVIDDSSGWFIVSLKINLH